MQLLASPVVVNGVLLEPAEEAVHLGVVRSPRGNDGLIADRINTHRKALYGMLHVGLAAVHNGNPSAAVAVDRCFGIPVLLSGLATLLLSQMEVNFLAHYFKVHVQQTMKMYRNSTGV